MNPKNEDFRVDLSWKRYLLPPIHKEGWRFVIAFAIITVGFYILSRLSCIFMPFVFISLLLTIFTYYFFRNPTRITPQGDTLIIAPADGIVSNITQVVPSQGPTQKNGTGHKYPIKNSHLISPTIYV